MGEPEIAIVASPREWTQRLHRHVADHGGARIRATVLDPHDAIVERYEVLILDDSTSFLSSRLLAELRRRGRRVLGVHEAGDEQGVRELRALGVDALISRDAPPEAFLRALDGLRAPTREGPEDGGGSEPGTTMTTGGEDPPPRSVVFVGGPPGGTGVTETAIALAAAVAWRGEPCVLVDGDERAPAVAQRLAVDPYPNILAALDASERGQGRLEDTLHPLLGGLLLALPGVGPGAWSQIRASEVHGLLGALLAGHAHLIVDGGARPWGDEGGSPAGRALVEAATALVGVGAATPVGLARLATWAAGARALNPQAGLHLTLNRVPQGHFRKLEVKAEVERVIDCETVVFAPPDPRVDAAAWAGGLVGQGGFVRAIRQLAAVALPALHPAAPRTPSRAALRRAGPGR